MEHAQPDKRSVATPRLLGLLGAALALAVALSLDGCGTQEGADPLASSTPADRFANTDNTPFATRTSGPRGAICYEVGAEATAEVCTRGLDAALAADAVSSRETDAASAYVEMLVREGLKRPDVVFRAARRAMPVREGKPAFLSLANASQRAAGDLTFTFEGFSASDKQILEGIATAVYPLCKTYYGAPAFAHAVKVRLQPSLSNMAEGVYDAGSDTIDLAPLSDNKRNTEFALVRQMLHAFRDDAMLFYDSWEEGQVLAVTNQVMAVLESDWDPSIERPEYNLNLYEMQNAPELGNDAIWNSGFSGLIVPRLGCASGAWMKVLVEDPTALARFNAAYYPLFRADTTVAGDVPRLSSLVAGVVPTVEGLGFWDWLRRQYALDTSLPVGQRFYVGMIPTYTATAMFVTNTTVGSDGKEAGHGGTVALEFWDYTHTYSLFVQEGYEITIPDSGTRAGLGEYSGSLYNVGGAQRITIDLRLDSIVRHAIYPYNSRREDLDYNADPKGVNLYGAIAGRDDGTVSVSVNGAAPAEVPFEQGAFRGHFGDGFIKPGKLTFTYTDPTEGVLTRTYNTGYFDYVILGDMGTRATLAHTFPATTTGLRLISFPGTPLATDEATVFGLAKESVLLASWQPELAGDDKYRIYPDVPPLAPGRGYWLRSSGDVSISVPADLPHAERAFRIRLGPGWNLIGIPEATTILPGNLRFDQGDETVSYLTAVQNGWVRGVLYEYDGALGAYGEASSLSGWEGYWIRCISPSGCNLVFFEDTAASARGVPQTVAQRLRAQGASVVEVEIRQGGTASRAVLALQAGAREDASDPWDAEAPPPAPGGAGLRAGVLRDSGLLSVDVSDTARRRLAVGASSGGGPVTLTVLSGSLSVGGALVASGQTVPVTLTSGGAVLEVRLP